jgi:hypothetical protein
LGNAVVGVEKKRDILIVLIVISMHVGDINFLNC